MKFETILERIGGEMIRHLPFVAVALMVSLTASAQTTKRIPLPLSQNPRNADLPIAAAVWAGDTLYVSGWLDPELKTHQDTKSQTEGLNPLCRNLTTDDLNIVRVVWPRQRNRAGRKQRKPPRAPSPPSAARGSLLSIRAPRWREVR
jgi:hypothetical protein